MDWETFRLHMPVAERWAYFDHAAIAPLPRRAQQVIGEWANDVANDGDVSWPTWHQHVVDVRARGARLLGAREDEVALVRNTTEGITLVAEGWDWKPGDAVVVPAGEFPSNSYPWLNLASRGVEIRRVARRGVRLEVDDVVAAIDARVRIVSVSWVDFAAGWRLDLGELADRVHAKGALLFVDAIQGLGMFPIDGDIDFLAADGHKWLLGPEGAGLFWARRELLGRLRPIGVGWASVDGADSFADGPLRLPPRASRYEGGTFPVPSFLGFGAALSLIEPLDRRVVASRLLEVTDWLVEGLRSAGATVMSDRTAGHDSGIVAFESPGESPDVVRQRLLDAEVVVSVRGGRLRASPHVYTNRDDVARLLEAL